MAITIDLSKAQLGCSSAAILFLILDMLFTRLTASLSL